MVTLRLYGHFPTEPTPAPTAAAIRYSIERAPATVVATIEDES